ncbi:MAG: hypothetical protein LBL31_05995 [Spirochaetaceae bacterium]|jgi:hypothetical protein|nr:hypothetical protein [Spirochaetaceae bacterium]
MRIIVEDTCGSLPGKAAGNSTVLACQRVAKAVKANPAGFVPARYGNFDEIPVKGRAEGVTVREWDRLFFASAGIPASRIHPRFALVPDKDAAAAL